VGNTGSGGRACRPRSRPVRQDRLPCRPIAVRKDFRIRAPGRRSPPPVPTWGDTHDAANDFGRRAVARCAAFEWLLVLLGSVLQSVRQLLLALLLAVLLPFVAGCRPPG